MKCFFRFLKNELSRLFRSKVFLALTLALFTLTVIDGVQAWAAYRQNLDQTLQQIPLREDGTFSQYPGLDLCTLYNSWLGGRVNQLLPQIFLYSLPIFSVLPYAGSYLAEEKSGYARTMVSLLGKPGYFAGKHIAVFCSGFFIAVLPLCFSLGFAACLVPACRPNVNFSLYYQVDLVNLLQDLYYTRPLLTAFLATLRVGIFAGAWATVPYVLSFFVKNRFVALLSPYLVLLFVTASLERALVYRSYLETSILDYIWLTSGSMTQNLWVFLGEMLALLLIPFFITLIKGGKSDVF